MHLLMIRHGEIPSNVVKVYAGRSPEGLTERGKEQAEKVAEKLKGCGIFALYSSPIRRAIETAEIVGKKTGHKPRIENAFREMEMGSWEGMSEDDIASGYPEEWNIWQKRPAELKLPGRETIHKLQERVLGGVKKIFREEPEVKIAVITHVAIIRVLLLWQAKKSLNLYKTIDVSNAEVFEIEMNTCPSGFVIHNTLK